ncbi:MAG: sigma-70 family RNA polymerase sigma factor [Prosthecobacter sp.]|uniref:sigma-70 family RNA polymerase sigma factor n=1 Tax=Prosthecobacter sp. TaxID=1965333 RepID=UPI0039008F82
MTTADTEKHDRFLRLYVEHEGPLRGFVRSLVPTLEDAREVMQETAAVLWRKFDETASSEGFRRWAFGVAKFEALAFVRDRARDRHVFGDAVLAALETDAMEAAETSLQEESALEECLQKLTPAQRTLVEAAYAPSARMGELARASGRTVMSIYKTLHRIRIALVECTQLALQREGRA